MAKQVISLGTTANDKTGDTIRVAFDKVNDNFTELYEMGGGGNANTGNFTFTNNIMSISNDDMDLETTRTGWDTDADIGLYAADDLWLDAAGDEVRITAANDVRINSRGSSMYENQFYGDEQDFVGTWNGTTITIGTIFGSTLDNLLAYYVSNSNTPIWLETSDGFVELDTTNNAENPAPAVYTMTVSASSPSADLNILSIKVWDNTQVYNSQWTFRRDGVTQIPGPIDFDTRTIDLHNGGNQTAQILQFNTAGYQAVITGPTPSDGNTAERLIIQGQRATGQGEGGDVYVWGGDADTNGGDIKIYAGDADAGDAGYGGYVNIDAGYGYNSGGHVQISAGNSTENGGTVTISAGNGSANGVIYLQTNGHTWTLDAAGALTLPTGGDIKYSSGASVFLDIRTVSVPTSSVGQSGDLHGDVAFNASYMYYCKQDYVGLTWTTIPISNAIQYGSDPMSFRVDLSDITNIDKPLRLYNLVVNGVGAEYAEVQSIVLVSGNTYDIFCGPEVTGFYQSTTLKYSPDVLPDIWKRVAWSNDTW